MAGLLLLGSVPIGLIGLVSDANGLIVTRFFIGIIGAAFVPCQYWASQMFSSEIVGTANAICGGFGNMGAGVSYLVIPLLYDAIATSLPPHQAWRVTFVIPTCLCILMAAADYFLGDDCPNGDWKNRKSKPSDYDVEQHGMPQLTSDDNDSTHTGKSDDEKSTSKGRSDNKITEPSPSPVQQTSVAMELLIQLKNPSVLILMVQYGCSFGLELAVDNVIGELFHTHFGLSQTTSGMLGSIFGLMNLFSRASGGMTADYVNTLIGEGVQGRMLVHFCVLLLEGAFLIGFSFVMGTLGSSLVVLVLFSYFVQAGCGTTFCKYQSYKIHAVPMLTCVIQSLPVPNRFIFSCDQLSFHLPIPKAWVPCMASSVLAEVSAPFYSTTSSRSMAPTMSMPSVLLVMQSLLLHSSHCCCKSKAECFSGSLSRN